MDFFRDMTEMPGHLIRRLHQRSNAVYQRRIKTTPYEITSVQFAALSTLRSYPNIDQARLSEMIAYDRATIGDVVKRLAQKGYVERKVNPDDRRARTLCLTSYGMEVVESILPVVSELQADILENLTEDERRQFITIVKKIVHQRAL